MQSLTGQCYAHLMGRPRPKHPLEDNPFIEGFLDWMDSPEGELSVDALEVVSMALEKPMSMPSGARSCGKMGNDYRLPNPCSVSTPNTQTFRPR